MSNKSRIQVSRRKMLNLNHENKSAKFKYIDKNKSKSWKKG